MLIDLKANICRHDSNPSNNITYSVKHVRLQPTNFSVIILYICGIQKTKTKPAHVLVHYVWTDDKSLGDKAQI